jgi:hypothetical protein
MVFCTEFYNKKYPQKHNVFMSFAGYFLFFIDAEQQSNVSNRPVLLYGANISIDVKPLTRFANSGVIIFY